MNRAVYAMAFLFLLILSGCSINRFTSGALVSDPGRIMRYVDNSRYEADLSRIAIERVLRSPGHDVIRELCASRLKELGFTVELDSYGTGVNVIGRLEGTDKSGEEVFISAHYDSKYKGCPGADDNASGVAGALEAARVLSKGRYHRTLVVALWDEEEKGLKSPRGLIGSRSFAARAKKRGERIVLAMVFEMIGYRSSDPGSQSVPGIWKKYFPAETGKIAANKNRGDFISVTVKNDSGIYSDIFNGFADSLALPEITFKLSTSVSNNHEFRRSDHAAFWENGYPAMLISDTTSCRNRNYHCHFGRVDDVSKLDIDFACNTVRAAVATAAFVLSYNL